MYTCVCMYVYMYICIVSFITSKALVESTTWVIYVYICMHIYIYINIYVYVSSVL
jgi:hypothetical protein